MSVAKVGSASTAVGTTSTNIAAYTATAGNMLVGVVTCNGTSPAISDSKNGAWAADPGSGSGSAGLMKFFAVSSTQGGSLSITGTATGSTFICMAIIEVSGSDGTFRVASYTTATAQASANAPSVTVSTGDMAIAACLVSSHITAVGGGFTEDEDVNFGGNSLAHNTAAGADVCVFTGSGSSNYTLGSILVKAPVATNTRHKTPSTFPSIAPSIAPSVK